MSAIDKAGLNPLADRLRDLSWSAKLSTALHSNASDQRKHPDAASTKCALIRRISPIFRTLPPITVAALRRSAASRASCS